MPNIIVPNMQSDVSPAYEAGKAFRISEEFTIASNGGTLVIKFVSAVPFKLTNQKLSVHNGDVVMRAKAGSTESGTLATPIAIFGKNRWLARPHPYYTTQVAITTGTGTISGGTRSETLRAKASGASGQVSSIQGQISSFRSLPAGTYYLEFTAGANSCEFTFDLEWEEA